MIQCAQPPGPAVFTSVDRRKKYAALSYRTNNLGDDIQSIAAEQFLPWIDLRIDRDSVNRPIDGITDNLKIVLNGWYTHAPQSWPPASFLTPLITSFHISREIWRDNIGGLRASEVLVRGESLRYLREHGSIGARDLSTLALLRESGVESHFSGCLTFTLGAGGAAVRGDYVCAVDLPEPVLARLRERTRGRLVVRTHHCSEGGPIERAYIARRLLSLYAHASCVVTTRLHCALPCLALGTPVLFLPAAPDSYRFAGLAELLHNCGVQDYLSGQVSYDVDNPPPNSDAFLSYRTELIRSVSSFCFDTPSADNLPPLPFQPDPISDRLLQVEPIAGRPVPVAAKSDISFRRIFRPGRNYKRDQRADFLRDIGRVHGESGNHEEALLLLKAALHERPDGTYIKQLIDEYAKRITLAVAAPDTPSAGIRRSNSAVATEVHDARLTYLAPDRLDSILEELGHLKAREVVGDFTEFGLALGGSGICIASQIDGARRYWGFDSFEMMPPPSEADGDKAIERYECIVSGQSQGLGGDRYYGYFKDLYETVVSNFARFGLRIDQHTLNLVRGTFQQTMPHQMSFPIAFAHIDCDWYDHVKYCLNFVHGRLSRFGVVIADDYNDWPGCQNAVDEFCAAREDVLLVRTDPHAVLLKL
jgi:hypothetical protein